MDAKTRKQHLEAQAKSGKTITAYCAEHHLSQTTFYKWRLRFHKRSKALAPPGHSPTAGEITFREVIPPPSIATSPVTEYRIGIAGSRILLTIPRGFDPKEVKALLSLARKTGC